MTELRQQIEDILKPWTPRETARELSAAVIDILAEHEATAARGEHHAEDAHASKPLAMTGI